MCSFLTNSLPLQEAPVWYKWRKAWGRQHKSSSLVKGQMTFTDLVQKWDSETDAKFGRNDAHPSLFPAVLPARKEHYSYTHELFIINQYCASL